MEVDAGALELLLATEYGLVHPDLKRLFGGADALACTYSCDVSFGKLFVKVSQRVNPGQEVQPTLARFGVPGIGAVLPNRQGPTTTKLGDGFVRVYEWVEGKNGFETPLSSSDWSDVGLSLRTIHQLPSTAFDCRQEQFEVEGSDEFVAEKDWIPELRSLGARYRDQIQEVLHAFSVLGQLCRDIAVPYVLCHSDIHIGNILVQPSGPLHIVDWDEPKIAPRECDLVYFLDGGVLGGKWLADERAFLEGYGEVEAVPELLTYYRYSRVLADLIAYAREAVTAEDTVSRVEACRMFEIQFAPGMPFDMAQRARRRHA